MSVRGSRIASAGQNPLNLLWRGIVLVSEHGVELELRSGMDPERREFDEIDIKR